MTIAAKRRIQVASFSLADLSRHNLATFAGGVALLLAAGGSGWVSASNMQSAAHARGAARLLAGVANQAVQGIQGYGAGGSQRLTFAHQAATPVTSAMADLSVSAGAWSAAPSLQRAAAGAAQSWIALQGALVEASAGLNAAAELNEALAKASPNISALLKALQASGKNTGAHARAWESLLRLVTYAEAGVGPASVPRVDYDLRVLVADLGPTEFRTAVAFAAPLAALSQPAAARTPTRDQLSKILDAAGGAKASAEMLNGAAMQTSVGMWGAVVAGGLVMLGIVTLWVALKMMVGDFGKRYHRGVQQFRAGEGAKQTMLTELRAIVDSPIADSHTAAQPLSELEGDFREIAQLVNEIGHQQRRGLAVLHAGVQAASADSSTALQALHSAQEESRSMSSALETLAQRLKSAAHLAELQALDARAASHAADQASWRCADAACVAQDTASRMAALREGLQETSQGIKRLGERTQEIDTVVDGMELLAEQIGVLALNASLEAERAGEHGAGFRVVAQEIQAIARRAGEATHQVGTLVKSAQADARSASEAVHRSTAHVVAGGSVAAVSHALLGVLAPLVAGVDAVARAVSGSCAESQAQLAVASDAAAHAAHAAGNACGSQSLVGDSLARVQGQLAVLTPNG